MLHFSQHTNVIVTLLGHGEWRIENGEINVYFLHFCPNLNYLDEAIDYFT